MVEKIIPGGLAMGVRNIVNTNSIKVRDMLLDDGDFLMGYTDGIIEARNSKGELFGLERLAKAI
jgi:serine phosphatase RsbU (regulator of sigma subunit)